MAHGLSFWGSLASIGGLGVSVWVLIDLWKLRKEFLLKARLPVLITDLEERATGISNLLRDYPQTTLEIQKEISLCESALKNLTVKLGKEDRQNVETLLQMIQNSKKDLTKRVAESIYRYLVGVVQDLKYLIEDQRWR